jgi:hypothetical protein
MVTMSGSPSLFEMSEGRAAHVDDAVVEKVVGTRVENQARQLKLIMTLKTFPDWPARGRGRV